MVPFRGFRDFPSVPLFLFSWAKAMSTNSAEISLLLDQYREGQPEAFGKLMGVAYEALRRLAAW